MKYVLSTLLLCLLGCASSKQGDTFMLKYSVLDDQKKSEFIIKFNNKYEKNVCLSPSNWPNSAGKINQASDVVWVEIGVRRFPVSDFNTGYCYDCVIKVKPGESISAKIPYGDFQIPDTLRFEYKSLHFEPVGNFCN